MDEKPSCLRKFVFSTGFHNAVSEQGDAQSSPGFDELRKMKNKFLEEVTTFPKQVTVNEEFKLSINKLNVKFFADKHFLIIK